MARCVVRPAVGSGNMDYLASLIARHTPGDGMFDTAIPGMALIRQSQPTDRIPVLHQPAVCIIAQGAKVVMLGEETYRYDAASHLVVSVDLPLTGQVTEASARRPYLCLRIDLDAALADRPDGGASAPPGRRRLAWRCT